MTIEDLLEQLRAYDKKTKIAYCLWLPEDVQSYAEESNLKITEEQAVSVIEDMEKHKDMEHGLTWRDIEYRIYDLNHSDYKECKK